VKFIRKFLLRGIQKRAGKSQK